MNKKKATFKVGKPLDRIELHLKVDGVNGEEFDLLHVFRGPTAADKKLYYKTLAAPGAEDEKPNPGEQFIAATEALYDACIIETGGDYEVEDGMSPKDCIPLEHKQWAVDSLLSLHGTLKKDAAKN